MLSEVVALVVKVQVQDLRIFVQKVQLDWRLSASEGGC